MSKQKFDQQIVGLSGGVGALASVAAVGAAMAAPTGMTAVGVSLGIVSAPAICTIAPVLGVGAALVATGAGAYKFYRVFFDNED